MRSQDEAEFRDWVITRQASLLRYARRLTRDWYEAEDLVQLALVRLYANWARVNRRDELDAYVRRSIYNVLLDNRSSAWSRHERVIDVIPDVAVDQREDREDHDPLLAALGQLPPRQRAAMVLRYWEDCTVEETAELLDCSTGTVKSQRSRGAEKLRALVDLRDGAV